MVALIKTAYTVKLSNYGWDQSDKFMKIYINFTGVHQVLTENVQVHFTERSFDLLVKNLNGKSYSMIMNNLLKPISVEGSSKKVKKDTVPIYIKKAENTQWNYLTQVEKNIKRKIRRPMTLKQILLLLLLSHFSRVRLCVTPETAAHQAP